MAARVTTRHAAGMHDRRREGSAPRRVAEEWRGYYSTDEAILARQPSGGHTQVPPSKAFDLIDGGADRRVRPAQQLSCSIWGRRFKALAGPLDNRLPLLHNSPTMAAQLNGRRLEDITACPVILAIRAAGGQGA